ncbi:MAG TPA: hypothetical protein PKD90_09095 [Phnomibacter sp.]|nr:hypothetical protein [Phnomibacter sp.]
MQNRGYLLVAAIILCPALVLGQTTFIPLWAKDNGFLDRLEIKAQVDNDLNLSAVKPYMRKAYVQVADSFRALLLNGQNPARLTKVDEYNLNRFQANNSEFSRYTAADFPNWKSKKPWSEHFFPTPGNFIEVNTKDFYLSVNPAVNQQQSLEKDFDKRVFVNSKGVTARGLIANKIGFHFFLTDNQEQGPLHYRQFVDSMIAVPGAGFYKSFKQNGYDYFDARGSVSWNVTKYINMQFGYDKNFIGNGHRSLLLSDFSNNMLFLKFNTRIWKINYTNLFMELFPTFGRRRDNLLDRKYAAMHHFSINATKWLNVGLFESIIFGRANRFDFSYLLPVIFFRSIEQQNGSPDNANIGFDFKANIAKKFQAYGQFMLDELNISELRKDKTWWGNKQAFQLGGKYVDVFGIPNLDAQVEYNWIRPFTYSHYDSVAAYNHYQQPLAHPRGSNTSEVIGILKYQPLNKLYLQARLNYWQQGLDSTRPNFVNNGANPNVPNNLRKKNSGYRMLDGVLSKGIMAYLVASYEIKENLFIDASMLYRTLEKAGGKQNVIMPGIGLRWNMFRRDYDF